MPLILHSPYHPPLWLRSGHLQTIIPALLRKVPPVAFRAERIATADGDFLDLDWLQAARATDEAPPPPLAILTHGLEGSSSQPYIRAMAAALHWIGWDVLAWNFRGCSGEPNLCLRSYHSGATDDLQCVIDHAAEWTRKPPATILPTATAPATAASPVQQPYTRIALIGFSLGGNLVLKYAAETAQTFCSSQPFAAADAAMPMPCGGAVSGHAVSITHVVGISVPCDLTSSTSQLERPQNRLYMARFLKTLRAKIRSKQAQFPEDIDLTGLDAIRTFREFDDRYTAPLHGFADAAAYWKACSCLPLLPQIRIPALILNAADDPFLSPQCFPREIAAQSPFIHLEVPRHGGHIGFIQRNPLGQYYSEQRVAEFLGACTATASAGSQQTQAT